MAPAQGWHANSWSVPNFLPFFIWSTELAQQGRSKDNVPEYYIHTTAIKKWDLCAADAIIRAAGGALIDLEGRPIDYSSNLSVLNKKGLLMSRKNTYGTFMKIKDRIKL